MKRLICLLRGHQRIRKVTAVTPLGDRAYRITASHHYCGRCGKEPL